MVSEKSRRPAEKVHQLLVDKFEGQVEQGLAALDAWKPDPWLVGEVMSRADITVVCGYTFMKLFDPDLIAADRYPYLEALATRCEALPAFAAADLEG